jgi:tRNA G18 (ribose-2'-O)-methylase SpoU
VQTGTTCTAVPLRLCIGTKALKAAVLVGDFPAHNLAAACHSRNVTEDELKNWLKPERDENSEVSEAELEKLISKTDWLYGVSYVFTVD